ncbi:MAG TPA: anaerobic ribonucleoside-triphosphate reductase activating protein [Spirochaetota bacterium]|nr:anaerobic ribonucleoside-triphosphate reductase activating protein [Spirochaetota bacterium]
MNIKGIHKTSLIDFPGRICSVFFTGGCNLRCGYCHNPELACNSGSLRLYSNDEALGFIKKRRGFIDGVTISGGEPTISRNLESFIGAVKEMSMAVKIDTNGLNPEVVARLVDKALVDYIAIDIKTSPQKYDFVVGRQVDFSRVIETVETVKSSGLEYELRTTCIPKYVKLEDFGSIGAALGRVKRYYLQQFVADVTLDESFHNLKPYPVETLYGFREYVATFADLCELRGV